jgi:hypothetical protein
MRGLFISPPAQILLHFLSFPTFIPPPAFPIDLPLAESYKIIARQSIVSYSLSLYLSFFFFLKKPFSQIYVLSEKNSDCASIRLDTSCPLQPGKYDIPRIGLAA